MKTAIYTLTSELHDETAVGAMTRDFLGELGLDYDFKGSQYDDYGSHPLDLIYVRTGGTEGIFKRLLPVLLEKSDRPFYLLTSGKSNSLAASMEILTYLNQQDIKGEILHGSAEYINSRIAALLAKERLKGCRLGVIGKPSDWLISSHADYTVLREKLGLEIVDIPMEEVLEALSEQHTDSVSWNLAQDHRLEQKSVTLVQDAVPGAIRIYEALNTVVRNHHLQGFTIRCFDLLTTLRNTGCLALAKLNSEGIVAGCEGDVPTMVSMKIVQALTGMSGFQANPSNINPETGEISFAHCTIPLNMVERYELDTHFESGIGVGIRGFMAEGDVTIFKVSGDLSRSFIAEGTLIRNEAKPDRCRTQQVIQLLDKSQASYFLTESVGNHHVIVPGHLKAMLKLFL